MEYRINKIDTDLRRKINEERSEDKIHNKKGINISKDKENAKENMEHKASKGNEKVIDNNNDPDKKTEVQDPFRGHHIDIRR
jgi:hypothetical protein